MIDEGVTGFVVATEEEAMRERKPCALSDVSARSTGGMCACFKRRFTAMRMADIAMTHSHLRVPNKLLSSTVGEGRPLPAYETGTTVDIV